jgi:aspartate racemase
MAAISSITTKTSLPAGSSNYVAEAKGEKDSQTALLPKEVSVKTIGIVGGIGPESTIEYYRLIIKSYVERIPDGSYPPIIINSIDLKRLLDLVTANELAVLTKYLVSEIQRLGRAGAECGLVAANTPHIVFDEVRRQSPIPLISIVEATCAAAKTLGLRKLGLFGPRFTMQGRFYPDVFSKEGIALAVPSEADQAFIHHIYFNELVKGTVLPETRERLFTIVDRLKERAGIQGLILGGTELSLILRDASIRDIPVLDTTKIHAKAIVAEALSQ